VTTDDVLDEALAAVSGLGPGYRQQAALMVRRIQANAGVECIAQSRASFMAGLELYERRPDKGYSLTDCISMSAMRARGINDALTNDHHFEQEGFGVLIRK
jgi:predicted nucleic acid-binding protein